MVFQTSDDEAKRGRPWAVRLVSAGMRITTMMRAMILKVLPYELKVAIQRVGMLEMQPWMSMMRVVRSQI